MGGKYNQSRDKDLVQGDLEAKIFDRLSTGKRVKRGELCRLCKTSDRQVRKTIENLRSKGIRICSGNGEAGYYLARTDEEYKIFEREYLSRAYTALNTARAMRQNNSGQMRLVNGK